MPNKVTCLNILNFLGTHFFQNKKKLYLIIDDTLIRKVYLRYMRGAGMLYDAKIGRRYNGLSIGGCNHN